MTADTAGTGLARRRRRTVAGALRAAILQGEFAPGQRLVEADLCERFGASRFIVRAALQELSAQGLVEFQRNRGARVREISLGEAIEITEVRKLLEGLQAARAAERVTAAEAAALRGIVTDMRAAVSRVELLRYSELNARCTRRSGTSRRTRRPPGCSASSVTRPCGTSSRCPWCRAGRPSRCRSTKRSSRR